MNKAYKVSHILDDVLEAYDDESGMDIDPDSYYIVNDGEIIDGPFDTEDEANDASENDDDEILMGSEINDEYEDDDYEEDYDIYEEEGGEKKKGCGKGNRRSKSKKRPGECYAIRPGVRGRPRGDNCKKGQKNSPEIGCYFPVKGMRGRPKKVRALESLASSIIRKINSF